MTTHTVTYFCNLDLRNKWFGYKPAHLVMRADEAEVVAKDRQGAADEAFRLWNIAHPAHYRGPSLSVGDVVQVRLHGVPGVKFYACASFGWDEITPPIEFVPDPPMTLEEVLAAASDRINEEGFEPA